MITINKYDRILRQEFKQECVCKGGGAVYCVSGIEVEDLLGDIENLNEFLVDTTVENGYLLEGVSYKFIGRAADNGTATIQVTISDTERWLDTRGH
jgi:hypothetical protein